LALHPGLTRLEPAARSTNAQLVGRYVEQQYQSAFTAILEHHGPLVLAVGRQVLRDASGRGERKQPHLPWDIATGWLLPALMGQQARIQSPAFTTDGRRLTSGSDDTTALVGDVAPTIPGSYDATALISRPSLKELHAWIFFSRFPVG
jgi:hypothetical protein